MPEKLECKLQVHSWWCTLPYNFTSNNSCKKAFENAKKSYFIQIKLEFPHAHFIYNLVIKNGCAHIFSISIKKRRQNAMKTFWTIHFQQWYCVQCTITSINWIVILTKKIWWLMLPYQIQYSLNKRSRLIHTGIDDRTQYVKWRFNGGNWSFEKNKASNLLIIIIVGS